MTPLFGHEEAIAAFRESLASRRLHHAWLINGPVGIGKALFAHKAAIRVLVKGADPAFDAPGLDVPDTHPTARLVEAGSHPDLVRLERLARDNEAGLARNISVGQVRGLQRLFTTTSAMSPWRVVIIDAADDLERSAANALLKNLEEPPPDSLFLLISHAPQRLLPTIRSRCRQLRLSTLSDAAMTSALQAALPDADRAEIDALREAGKGAPGRAIHYRGLEIAALDRALREIMTSGDPGNAQRSALAEKLSLPSAQARYEVLLERVPALVAEAARRRRGPALAQALTTWEKAQDLAGSAVHLSLDPHSVVFELGGMLATLASPAASERGINTK